MKTENKATNWPHIGNTQISQFLENSIRNNKVGGAYIFNGPDNLGKTTVARYFASLLMCGERGIKNVPCNACASCRSFLASAGKKEEDSESRESEFRHSDCYILKKDIDKKFIAVGEVREFIRSLSLSSFLGGYKIGIIKGADNLNKEAANALLKTLEEPRKKVVIILITQDMDSLPATIVSRCQILNFRPVEMDEIYDYLVNEHKTSRDAARDLAHRSLGRPALAVKFLDNKEYSDNYNSKARMFMDFYKEAIHERLRDVDALIDKKTIGQEAVAVAKRTIEIWAGVLRDWLLLEYNFGNLIQNIFLDKELREAKTKVSIREVLRMSNVLREAEENLRANVNPKLVLENIVISI